MTPRTMSTPSSHHGTAAGTLGGTLLSIFANVQTGDITKTVILAAIGATVSFMVSLALKWITRRKR